MHQLKQAPFPPHATSPHRAMGREEALAHYQRIREESERLCRPLHRDDYMLQSIPSASPPKWHLAHMSWFFETFLLERYLPGYRPFHPQFRILFNSYYEQVGPFHPRPQRGLLSRPDVDEVYRYRAWVDEMMGELIDSVDTAHWPEVALRLAIGLHHEQQHQELLLTDTKHNLWCNPLFPAYDSTLPADRGEASALQWYDYPGGVVEIGAEGEGFAYDNEWPRHRHYLEPYRLASRLVTNGDYLAFIADGGYERPELWLSDGWTTLQREQWRAPLYWLQEEGEWWLFTLGGLRRLEVAEPVAHLSYYEADAYARWAGKRLPSEQEWEQAARAEVPEGNLRDSGRLHPVAAVGGGMRQLYGDLWEWSASPYSAYPGYRPPPGAIGEYNGKFMCNQMVLRGGSCATPADHIRASYRNFFYPHERWQFMGLRLAEDGA